MIASEAARFNVLACGRRAGKTALGLDLVIDAALDSRPAAWFSPTYKMLSDVWREAQTLLEPVIRRVNAQERRLSLWGGGSIEFWSLDNPDAPRGRKYARAVVDEAAMIPSLVQTFGLIIRPTLIDYVGDAFFLSTPRGLNGFYQLFVKGQSADDADWRAWQLPTSVNPLIDPAEIAAARRGMTDLEYSQEILAQFVDLSGSVFRGIDAAAVSEVCAAPQVGRRYVMGVDLASSYDYTVITVLDVTDTTARQVALSRFGGVSWRSVVDRVAADIKLWRPDLVEVDRTGVGAAPFEELAGRLPDVQLHGVTFNAGNKMSMVQTLAAAIERGDLHILADDTQLSELRAYEAVQRQSGVWSYNAPDGGHDDTVSALMLAYDAATIRPWGVVVL